MPAEAAGDLHARLREHEIDLIFLVAPTTSDERLRKISRLASGFIYGYLAGLTLERAVRMGNACGAIVVTRHGCANFMPTLDEIQTFVAAQGGSLECRTEA